MTKDEGMRIVSAAMLACIALSACADDTGSSAVADAGVDAGSGGAAGNDSGAAGSGASPGSGGRRADSGSGSGEKADAASGGDGAARDGGSAEDAGSDARRSDGPARDAAPFICPLDWDGGSGSYGFPASDAGLTDSGAEGGTEPDAGLTDAALAIPAIFGCYVDDFGGRHIVDRDEWVQPSSYGDTVVHFTVVDNAARFIVGQNDAVDSFNPGAYSRFEWTVHMGDLYMCQVAYDAASEAGALAAGPADANDPASGGCNGFPWSRLEAHP